MFSVPLSRHPVANSAALFIPSCTTSRFSPSFTNLAPRPNPKFAACSSILQEKNHEASSAADDALKGKGGRLESVKGTSLPLFAPMKTAKRVVLVRHGQSTWNAEGRIQGSSDFSVLTPKGESQAETSRLMLIDDVFDVCFSSPLKRSKRTADVIWGNREEAMITNYDLREIDLYSFQGLLKREGKEKFGAAFHQWKVDAPNFVIDEHYPVRELWERAKNCWISILAHESKSVLVVAHNAVNQALIATALGLGTEYFRILLQSNCGVSVLDFTPKPEGGSPLICLNRLNQTPSSPIAGGSSAGREGGQRIILVCHGALDKNEEASSLELEDPPMNMLGVIQSQKTAELLLDLNVSKVVSSPKRASKDTAETISRVQEAADCLGADCVPRYVEMKQIEELDAVNIYQQAEKPEGINSQAVESLWAETGKAWRYLLDEYSGDPDSAADGENIVVVAHPMVHVALMTHCLNLTVDWVGYFHVDEGSISVIDFPDGPEGRGVVRCINYTAHLGRWSIPITKM